MAARLPADLLERSAQESSRLICLTYLDQIDRAHQRLTGPRDAEALHDFRVGLRRLRSCIRAYRPQLEGSVTKKMRRRLRKLMLATNAGRDTEVQLAWLQQQAGRLESEDLQGLFWLIGRLEGRKCETLDPAAADIGRRYPKTAGKFRQYLGTLRLEIGAGSGKRQLTFGEATGELIQQQASQLGEALERVRDAANVKEAHRARIAIKRLRYLLEPMARRVPGARGLITRLKEAQDLLGALHDMHVLSEEIASSLAALTGSNPPRLPESETGLRTVEHLAQEAAAAAFAGFGHQWGGGRAGRFLSRADEIARSLREGSAELPPAPDPSPVIGLGRQVRLTVSGASGGRGTPQNRYPAVT